MKVLPNGRYPSPVRLLLVAAMLSATSLASAGLGVNVTVSGNAAIAVIDFPGVPPNSSELTLTFDNPQNLLPANLGISASLITLPVPPALQARLPDLNLMTVQSAFPVLIVVEPSTSGGLAFDNAVHVELRTQSLPYGTSSPLRLLKAPLGGMFRDITEDVAPGSVRTSGRTGGFSEFLIVADQRPPLVVANVKLTDIELYLVSATVSGSIRSTLQDSLTAARNAFQLGCYEAAHGHMGTFQRRVEQFAGVGILNSWTSVLPAPPNDAGELLGSAASLRFALMRLRLDTVFLGGYESGEAACNSP